MTIKWNLPPQSEARDEEMTQPDCVGAPAALSWRPSSAIIPPGFRQIGLVRKSGRLDPRCSSADIRSCAWSPSPDIEGSASSVRMPAAEPVRCLLMGLGEASHPPPTTPLALRGVYPACSRISRRKRLQFRNGSRYLERTDVSIDEAGRRVLRSLQNLMLVSLVLRSKDSNRGLSRNPRADIPVYGGPPSTSNPTNPKGKIYCNRSLQ